MKREDVARSGVPFLVFQSHSEIICMYMKYISSTAAALHEGERKKEKCDKGQTVRWHVMSKTFPRVEPHQKLAGATLTLQHVSKGKTTHDSRQSLKVVKPTHLSYFSHL